MPTKSPQPNSSISASGRIGHHVISEPMTVSQCLEKHFQLEKTKAEELLSLGAIYLNKRRVQEDIALGRGSYLRIHLEPKRFPVAEVDWKATLVAETSEFLVIRKPTGIPVHATLDNQKDNVLHQWRLLSGHQLLVTQRLDVPVTGLMILAKTPDFQRRFNHWLVDRKVKKLYRAIVDVSKGHENGPPAVGPQVHYMEPTERSPKRVTLEALEGWHRCELSILSIEPAEEVPEARKGAGFEVEIDLHTGRTHQIRAQLAALGCPIRGDRLYGSRTRYRAAKGEEAIALSAVSLEFPNPGNAPWEFKVMPPWRK